MGIGERQVAIKSQKTGRAVGPDNVLGVLIKGAKICVSVSVKTFLNNLSPASNFFLKQCWKHLLAV